MPLEGKPRASFEVSRIGSSAQVFAGSQPRRPARAGGPAATRRQKIPQNPAPAIETNHVNRCSKKCALRAAEFNSRCQRALKPWCPPKLTKCRHSLTLLESSNALLTNNLRTNQAPNPAAKKPQMLAKPNFQGGQSPRPRYASSCIFCITHFAEKQHLKANATMTYVPQNALTLFARPACIPPVMPDSSSASPRLRVIPPCPNTASHARFHPPSQPQVTTAQQTLAPSHDAPKIFC